MAGDGAVLVTHRFVARKHHKLRGQYLRVFGVGPRGFVNEDPATGAVTNRWGLGQLVDILVPQTASEPPVSAAAGGSAGAAAAGDLVAEQEFRVILQEGSGPFGSSRTTLTFSSPCRADLLCTLRANKLVEQKEVVIAQKRPRLTQQPRRCRLIAGESGLVEVDDSETPRVLHAYRFVDLVAVYRLQIDARDEGFVLVIGQEKRPHAFGGPAARGLLVGLIASCKAAGIQMPLVDEVLDLPEWRVLCEQYAKQADIGHQRGSFACTKAKSQREVIVQVTSTHIVERAAGVSSDVRSVRNLRRVHSVVCALDDSRSLSIQYHSEERTVEYFCDERDSFIAAIVDAATTRDLHIPISCGVSRPALRVCPTRMAVPAELELLYLRRLMNVATAHAQPGTRSKALQDFEAKQSLNRVVQACNEFVENSAFPMHSWTFSQLNSTGDLHGPGTMGLLSAACEMLRTADSGLVRHVILILQAIVRIVNRNEVASGHYQISQTPEMVSVIKAALQPGHDSLVAFHGLELLWALLGGGYGDNRRDRTVEFSNKTMLFEGCAPSPAVDASGDLNRGPGSAACNASAQSASQAQDLASLMVQHLATNQCSSLTRLAVVQVVERLLVSGRETTPPEVYVGILDRIVSHPAAVAEIFRGASLGVVLNMGLILYALVRDVPPASAAHVQREALDSGAVLHLLHDAFFAPDLEARIVHRFVVSQLLRDFGPGHDLLQRTLPAGLYHALGHPPLSFEELAGLRDISASGPTRLCSAGDRIDFVQRVSRCGFPIGAVIAKDRLAAIGNLPAEPKPAAEEDRLPTNFDVLFHMSDQDHELPDLLWNTVTRSELATALSAERQAVDTVAGTTAVRWNHEEFAVSYPSLASEMCVSGCYLRLLAPSLALQPESGASDPLKAVHQLRHPPKLFTALFQDALRSLARNKHCRAAIDLEAMSVVYKAHARAIGSFDQVEFLLDLLEAGSPLAVRDRAAVLLEELVADDRNCASLVQLGERATPLLLNCVACAHLEATGPSHDAPPEWLIRKSGRSEAEGPFNLAALARMIQAAEIDPQVTQVWAPGRGTWRMLDECAQIAWARMPLTDASASKPGRLGPGQFAATCVRVLDRMLVLRSTEDERGRSLVPAPRIRESFFSRNTILVLVNALLACSPELVIAAAALLKQILVARTTAMAKLFCDHGGVYFALGGAALSDESALLNVARLLDVLPDEHFAQVSHILPDSILNLLRKQGPAKFAQVLLGSFDTPEFIWTSDMRAHLQDMLAEHLQAFHARLAENGYTGYTWEPIPPVRYPKLEQEYYCCGYFLRNLCDRAQFPAWEVSEPVALEAAVIRAWRTEAGQSGSADPAEKPQVSDIVLTNDRAAQILGSPERGSAAALRAAFRTASANCSDLDLLRAAFCKLHRALFEEQDEDTAATATATTATTTATEPGPNQPAFARLLLDTLILLYSRHADKLMATPFTGFDLVTATLRGGVAKQAVAAVELTYRICLSSAKNADGVVNAGLLELLVDTLANRSRDLPAQTARRLVEVILRVLVGLSALKRPRDRLIEKGKVKTLSDTLCTILDRIPLEEHAPAQSVMQIIARLSSESNFQASLFESGLLWRIVPFLFRFEPGAGNASRSNVTAKHAARALSRMAGLLDSRDLATGQHHGVERTIETLLTPSVLRLFRVSNPTKLLVTLNAASTRSPLVVWNREATKEVIKFLEHPAKLPFDALSRSREGDESVPRFVLSCLADEPVMCGVYLRAFEDDPTVQLPHAPELAVELLAGTDRALQSFTDGEADDTIVLYLGAFEHLVKHAQDASALGSALVLAQPPVLQALGAAAVQPFSDAISAAAVGAMSAACSVRALAASIAQQNVLLPLLVRLESNRENASESIAQVAQELCKYPKVVSRLFGPEHGFGPLLRTFVDSYASAPARQASARALRACCLDGASGLVICRRLAAILTDGLTLRVCDGTALQVLDLVDAGEQVHLPDIVWEPAMLTRLRAALKDGVPAGLDYPELENHLCVGGIFVERLLAFPSFALRDAGFSVQCILEAFATEVDGLAGVSADGDGVSSRSSLPAERDHSSMSDAFSAAFSSGQDSGEMEGEKHDLFESARVAGALGVVPGEQRQGAAQTTAGEELAGAHTLGATPPGPSAAPPPPVPRRQSKAADGAPPVPSRATRAPPPPPTAPQSATSLQASESGLPKVRAELLAQAAATLLRRDHRLCTEAAQHGHAARLASCLARCAGDQAGAPARACLVVLEATCANRAWATQLCSTADLLAVATAWTRTPGPGVDPLLKAVAAALASASLSDLGTSATALAEALLTLLDHPAAVSAGQELMAHSRKIRDLMLASEAWLRATGQLVPPTAVQERGESGPDDKALSEGAEVDPLTAQ